MSNHKKKIPTHINTAETEFFENPDVLSNAILELGETELYENLVLLDLFPRIASKNNMESKIPSECVYRLTQLLYSNQNLGIKKYTEIIKQDYACETILKHALSGRQKVLNTLLDGNLNSANLYVHSLVFIDLAYSTNIENLRKRLQKINCSKTINSAILSEGNQKALYAWNKINESLFTFGINTSNIPRNCIFKDVKKGLLWFKACHENQ